MYFYLRELKTNTVYGCWNFESGMQRPSKIIDITLVLWMHKTRISGELFDNYFWENLIFLYVPCIYTLKVPLKKWAVFKRRVSRKISDIKFKSTVNTAG
jgi:hypothetical protein